MKGIYLSISFIFLILGNSLAQNKMDYNKLTKEEEKILIHKSTEAPFSGNYLNNKAIGTYVCKQCNNPLFSSEHKFDSNCGWPSFDDMIPGAVLQERDPDEQRTEILCSHCGGHLGHVFLGEGFTEKNTRHCVNSLSMIFIPEKNNNNMEKVYFAGGCFWGTEHHFKKANGVISTSVGYIGGNKLNPSYEEVCSGSTGHAEVVEVEYNPEITDFKDLARLFFEIHDFTQVDGQGPDIGEQYRTEIFYTNDSQKDNAKKLINILEEKGYIVATKLTEANKYWKAEDYHQDYYEKTGKSPYCHIYKKTF